MSDFAPSETRFTGRKMLIVMIAFFATIIAVNAIMLTLAVKNFGGLVVQNSYVASQRFNEDVAATQAQPIRNWDIVAQANGERIAIQIADLGGMPVTGLSLSGLAARPTHERENTDLVFEETGEGVYGAATGLARGVWKLTLQTDDGQRRTVELYAR